MHQTEIVFTALLKAYEQLAKAIVPRRGTFDHPAAGWMTLVPRYFLPAPPDMRRIASHTDRRVDRGEVIAFIQTQMLRMRGSRARPRHDHPIQRLGRRAHIVAVRRRHNHRQRGAALIRQRVAFGAEFAAIRRIGAGLGPPNGALTMALSRACQRQPMPWRRSYACSTVPQSC